MNRISFEALKGARLPLEILTFRQFSDGVLLRHRSLSSYRHVSFVMFVFHRQVNWLWTEDGP